MTGPGVASVVPEASQPARSSSSSFSSTNSSSEPPSPSAAARRARLQRLRLRQQLRSQRQPALARQVRTVLPLRLPPTRPTWVAATDQDIQPQEADASQAPNGAAGDDSAAEGANEETVVYGIPVVSDQLLVSARRVLVLSFFMGALHIVAFMIRWIIHKDERQMDDLWPEISELAIQLTIPICGYFGATHAHRTLLLVFCGATVIFVAVLIISCLRVLLLFSSNTDVDSTGTSLCEDDDNPGLRSPCSILSDDPLERIGFAIYASVYATSGLASLFAAKMLHSKLAVKSPEFFGASGMPLVGIVMEGEAINGLLPISGTPLVNNLQLTINPEEAPAEDAEAVLITVTSLAASSGHASTSEPPLASN